MQQKIIKTGNSLAVTIPSRVTKYLGLRPGQKVITKVDMTRGRLTHIFEGKGQLSLLSSSNNTLPNN